MPVRPVTSLALRACLSALAISVAATGYLYVRGLRSDLALAHQRLEAAQAQAEALQTQVETERAVRVAVDARLSDALAESEAVQERNRDLLGRISAARGGSRDGPVADVLRDAIEGLGSNSGANSNSVGGRK